MKEICPEKNRKKDKKNVEEKEKIDQSRRSSGQITCQERASGKEKIIHKTISFETVLQNFLYNMQHCFEKRDKTWSTGEGNGKPLQYSGFENPTNSMIQGLDLIERGPEELWTEVHDIVQEAVIQDHPQEKEMQKAKWLSEEAIQTAKKRREV